MGRRVGTSIACAAALVAAAYCAPAAPQPGLDAIASGYIGLAQDLARHDPTLIDHWLTQPAPAATASRQPVIVLQATAEALGRDLAAIQPRVSGIDAARARWLDGQTRALQLAVRRLLGESVPFDEEARQAFGMMPGRAEPTAIARARDQLERGLPGTGPLSERLPAFKARFQVPRAARDAVMRAALDACREATRDAVHLPADEEVETAFIGNLPWDAHARYLGAHRTRLDINGSAPLDLTRALHLACHEGYAGHHVQHIWLADELIAARGWREYALVPGFGPALLIAEGAAEAGAELALPPERRAAIYLGHLAPAAGLVRLTAADLERLVRVEEALAALEPLIADIARDYLDGRMNAAAAAERLEHDALVADAAALVAFVERRRTRILAYTLGRRVATDRVAASGFTGLHALLVPAAP
jgi:hypothetical protein